MARTNTRQRAYDAVKLFEGMGKTVKSITFLKGGEFKLEFVTEEDDSDYNEFDYVDFRRDKSEEPHPLDNIDWKIDT